MTLHRAVNFGAALQAWALHTVLSDTCGIPDCEIVDYFPENKVGIKAHVYRMVYGKRARKFRKFLSHARSSTVYHKQDNIARFYDVLIAGGDQIWNPHVTGLDSAYFLSFAAPGVKKYSYSASAGSAEAFNKITSEILSSLRDFSCVSLREACLFSRLPPDISPRIDPDPIFLPEDKHWDSITIPPKNANFILYYEVSHSAKLLNQAKIMASAMRARLIAVPYGLRRRPGISYAVSIGPGEFIGLIRNARHVFTNSFHGAALAIRFRKPLTMDIPAGAEGERLRELTARLKLQSRVLTPTNIPQTDAGEEYTTASQILKQEKIRALEYLNNIATDYLDNKTKHSKRFPQSNR